MTTSPRPPRATYAGVFFITLATLMHEILLTRIFSVALWYHFAFMAISVAMFGMTAGAIVVYLRPRTFTRERAPRQLAISALAYAVTLVASTVIFFQLSLDPSPEISASRLLSWGASYLVIAVPFVFSGTVVAIALTKYPQALSRLYAADLIGAALGCLLLVWVLPIAGGATSVFVVAAVAALGAAFFAVPTARGLRTGTGLTACGLAAFSMYHGALERENRPLLEITDAVKNPLSSYRYVRWNSHSRVGVAGSTDDPVPATGWGLSDKTNAREMRVPALVVTIDTFAATPMARFTGNTQEHRYLKDDVTNMAHYIRRDADVAVVGVGGGRDVLSALTFDQRSVLGVELNANVLEALTGPFADFSGHLDEHPKVELVHDEARSYLARSDRRFDIIQLSLIDTFAATAAGAFVLGENALYTTEAWTTFLRHLKPHGILTVSRWFYPSQPAEALRLASLGREALSRIGVENPRRNVILVKAPRAVGLSGELGSGVANILVSPSPFSDEDLQTLRRQGKRLGFEIVVSPKQAEEKAFERILSPTESARFIASFPLDLSAPTDDRPFFFNMLRITDFQNSLAINFLDPNNGQLKAVRLLVVLLVVVGVLTLSCLVVPLLFGTDRKGLRGNGSLLAYFCAIGFGFMFVEISAMQRLMILLGHPTYALSVVLFTLLIGTGIGSFLSQKMVQPGKLAPRGALVVLLGLLAVFGLAIPWAAERLAGAATPVRVGVAGGSLFVAGLFLGLPFPLGMSVASKRNESLMPWLWGLNGAASVFCSVLAAAVALSAGISATFWCGVACYAIALMTLPSSAGWRLRAT